MVENLADDAGIFSALASCVALPPASMQSNAGDGLDGTAAGLTGFDIDAEYPLEALCLYAYGCKLLPWMAWIPVLQERKPVMAIWRSTGVLSRAGSEVLVLRP